MGTERIYFTDDNGNTKLVEENDLPDQPLTGQEVFAALLAVKGVLTPDEAASCVGLTAEKLKREAIAWDVAAKVNR